MQLNCLNLGCGDDVRPTTKEAAWVNVDIRDTKPGVEVMDMTQLPWPWIDCTFDYVLADNVLEHFYSETFIKVLNEIDRVTKVFGRVEVVVPHAFSQGAHQDPTHRMFFVPRSCLYWSSYQTPFGGLAVGITANLVPNTEPEVYGDMRTEAFIRFRLTKMLPKQ